MDMFSSHSFKKIGSGRITIFDMIRSQDHSPEPSRDGKVMDSKITTLTSKDPNATNVDLSNEGVQMFQ